MPADSDITAHEHPPALLDRRLLGIQTETGEGTIWRLNQSWDWPSLLKLVAVVLLAVFVVGTYLKENRRSLRRFRMVLAGVRLLVVGILLVMLAQVTLLIQPTSLPYVAVIVDDSLSMAHADRYDDKLRQALEQRVRKAGFDRDRPSVGAPPAVGARRWNLACTLLGEDGGALLAELLERYKLRLYYLTGPRLSTADGEGKIVDKIIAELHSTQPSGHSTRLGAAIRTVLEDLGGSTPAAIVLLTDGINTEGPPLSDGAMEAARKGVPLYLVGLGDDQPERDVKLSDLLVDDEVFVDDVVYFEVKLSAVGYQGRQAQVVLQRKGGDHPADGARVLARTTVTLGPDGQSQPTRLAHRPTQEGEFTYVLEVEPLEGESQAENNRLERTLRVRKETIRVLLVWADPSWEFRYLRNMLERVKSIHLSAVLQNADRRHFEQDKLVLKDGFPAKADDLARYDVIILGDADREAMLPSMIGNIADFVEQPRKGGALIVIAGPRYMPLAWRNTPLERLLPIDLATARAPDPDRPLREGFTVRPTELGLGSPGMCLGDRPEESGEIWKTLPPLYWLLEAPDLKRGARVMAEVAGGGGREGGLGIRNWGLERDDQTGSSDLQRPIPNPQSPIPSPPPPAHGRPLPVILMQYVGAGKVPLPRHR